MIDTITLSQQFGTLKTAVRKLADEAIQYATDAAREQRRADLLYGCLQSIIEIGKRDLSNTKYDAYFTEAKELLKQLKPIK